MTAAPHLDGNRLVPTASPWRRKVQQAIVHRARRARQAGQTDPYQLLERLGWEPDQLALDAQVALDCGCPDCGVPAARVRVELIDQAEAPDYWTNAWWVPYRCPQCRSTRSCR